MTSTRAAASGSARGRRRPASRAHIMRRRAFAAVLAVTALGLAAALLYPMLHHAVKEITLPLRHEDIIRQQAARKHLDPALIAAVIYAESKFNARDSSTGAKGLMQIQPATARFIARRSGGTQFTVADLSDSQTNISYGSYYLRYLFDRYSGNAILALAAYNGGETNLDGRMDNTRPRRPRVPRADHPLTAARPHPDPAVHARGD